MPLPLPGLWWGRCREQVGATLPVTVSPVPLVRRLARKRRSAGDEDPAALGLSYKVHVASVNNFPTAAGLASSAAGYACLGGCSQEPRAPEGCAVASGTSCSWPPGIRVPNSSWGCACRILWVICVRNPSPTHLSLR